MIRSRFRAILLAIGVVLGLCAHAEPGLAQDHKLVVGVTAGPPFAIHEEDGTWGGLGVEMWRLAAVDLGWQYEFREFSLPDLRAALGAGTIDAGVGPLPVTVENDEVCDFSQPYLTAGLGLAQRATDPMTLRALGGILVDKRLLTILAGIVLAVLVVGVIVALIERRDSSDFGGPLRSSVSAGVWWAAVTMTTVGYGDTTPKTAAGRFVALVWMFLGVVVVAILTATVTSSLTVTHMQGVVAQPSDLLRLRLGVVTGGEAEDYLTVRHAHFALFSNYGDGLAALAARQIDAMVGNQPSLRYFVRQDWQGVLQVSSLVLAPESFGIAVPEDSPLRKPLDSAVIRARESEAWHESVHTHLGGY